MSAATPAWLRPSVDYGPIAIFFAVYHLKDLMWATGAIMAATVAALAIGYWFERRLAPLPLVTAAIVGVFGALTLVLADETFIKMKPTIIKGLLAGVLLCGLAAGRQPLRFVFGQVWPLSDEGWRTLTLQTADLAEPGTASPLGNGRQRDAPLPPLLRPAPRVQYAQPPRTRCRGPAGGGPQGRLTAGSVPCAPGGGTRPAVAA